MDLVLRAAPSMLKLSWLLFSGLLAWNHIRVRSARRRQGIPEEKPAIRDARSMLGLLLEGLSFVLAALFARPVAQAAGWAQAASMIFGAAAVVILFFALRHLGMEWRVKAVVTEDHTLVTTGPYAIVRHPVFAALMCLLLATVLLIDPPWAATLAVAVCVFGTEIRVRAEDGLLLHRFGARFREYQARVAAYIPLVR